MIMRPCIQSNLGVHGVKDLIADAGQASPDRRLEVMDIAADEDIVFVHWQATGRHELPPWLGYHLRHQIERFPRSLAGRRPGIWVPSLTMWKATWTATVSGSAQ